MAQDALSLPMRVLVGLGGEPSRRLDVELGELDGPRASLRVHQPGIDFPDPETFDVLVAWPAGHALLALEERKLQAIDGAKPILELGARPYGLIESSPSPGPWHRVLRLVLQGQLVLPDPFAEPGFLDALAAWASQQPLARVDALLQDATFRGTSAELRLAGGPAVFALKADEKPREGLPGTQLVVAVSARTRELPRAKALALQIHLRRERWFPAAWGQEVWTAPPLEIAALRARLRGPVSDGPSGSAEEWLDTALLHSSLGSALR